MADCSKSSSICLGNHSSIWGQGEGGREGKRQEESVCLFPKCTSAINFSLRQEQQYFNDNSCANPRSAKCLFTCEFHLIEIRGVSKFIWALNLTIVLRTHTEAPCGLVLYLVLERMKP